MTIVSLAHITKFFFARILLSYYILSLHYICSNQELADQNSLRSNLKNIRRRSSDHFSGKSRKFVCPDISKISVRAYFNDFYLPIRQVQIILQMQLISPAILQSSCVEEYISEVHWSSSNVSGIKQNLFSSNKWVLMD